MFLDILNDNQKIMFLDMATHVAQSNGLVDDAEQNMLSQYCNEMGISYEMADLNTIDNIISGFAGAEESVKKVVVFELLGLGYIDGEFDSLESSIVKDFALRIGLSEEEYNRLKTDLEEYVALVGMIQGHLFE